MCLCVRTYVRVVSLTDSKNQECRQNYSELVELCVTEPCSSRTYFNLGGEAIVPCGCDLFVQVQVCGSVLPRDQMSVMAKLEDRFAQLEERITDPKSILHIDGLLVSSFLLK